MFTPVVRQIRVKGKKWIFLKRCVTTNVVPELNLDAERDEIKTYDVVIAGGGMVGSAMACSLANSSILSGLKILLLEAGNPKILTEMPETFSNRVSSVNPASRTLLENLGVWKEISRLRAKTVKKLQVWEACSEALITYEQNNMEDDVSYIIENDVLVSALLKKAAECRQIEMLRKCKINSYDLPDTPASDVSTPLVGVNLEDGRKLQTRLLVGADGPGSMVRKAMGLMYVNWQYNQEAVVATVQLSEPTDNVVAWQRFLPTGPVALLPLSDRVSSVVWTNMPMKAKDLVTMNEDSFVDALNGAFWNEREKNTIVDSGIRMLNDFLKTWSPSGSGSVRQLPPSVESVIPNSRASFPLGLGHATEYVQSRIALIGDSAHRVHPLAGLGVNLGLGDVETLTEQIEKTVYDGYEVGTLSYLLEYEKQRQRHVVPTMLAIDGLNRLYSTRIPAIVLLRSLGLQLTDSCPPLKERIISHASS